MRTSRLPQLDAPLFVTDGGLETTLVFDFGIDLPDFAAFPLLVSDDGREHLRHYYAPYLELAERHGVGIILDTPTWRANPDWAARLGYDEPRLDDVNRGAVDFVRNLANEWPGVRAVVSGAIGPRGDGYVVGSMMSAETAASYHGAQIQAFADTGADLVSALTLTYANEAVGVALAAMRRGLPSVISFTVETDGRLPSGMTLKDAINFVDEGTSAAPAYYMVNCAHPSHLVDSLSADGQWRDRLKGIRANASRMSHAELDSAEFLDRGDVLELAGELQVLRSLVPDLRVVGGCCGTSHDHIAAIAATLV